MFSKFTKYFSEVRAELHKANWPWDSDERGLKKYKELIDSTIVVCIAMLLLAAFVALNDFAMRNIIELLTSR